MVLVTYIEKNTYQDSVALMKLSSNISKIEGVGKVSVVMGTPLNKAALEESGMLTAEAKEASAADLIMVVEAANDELCRLASEAMREALHTEAAISGSSKNEEIISSLDQACADGASYQFAFISTPGEFAAAEALKALKNGLNVFLFSDNVSLEDEIALKRYAHERDLLVMGPDCGTAHIGGIPVGFSNAVKKGGVGIIGASGTGTQEVMCLIDRFGGGISNVLGTGGRDLSREVGGVSMLDAMLCLKEDPDTKVVVLISKPPSPEVAVKIRAAAAELQKPVVFCFLGDTADEAEPGGIPVVTTLERAAFEAVRLETGACAASVTAESPAGENPEKYLRGLYSGGTLAYEAVLLLKKKGVKLRSNLLTAPDEQLPDVNVSEGHTVIDMGDDVFTRGKPHPMIDLTSRLERIRAEAGDPCTGVILLDVVLGYGSHPDPAAELAPIIRACREKREDLGFVAHICATDKDPQGCERQAAALTDAGAVTAYSNVAAVEKAWELLIKESGR